MLSTLFAFASKSIKTATSPFEVFIVDWVSICSNGEGILSWRVTWMLSRQISAHMLSSDAELQSIDSEESIEHVYTLHGLLRLYQYSIHRSIRSSRNMNVFLIVVTCNS